MAEGGASRPAPFMTGSDWSVGLNSATSLDQLVLLNVLGSGLRREYQALLHEPLPEHLTVLVERLDAQEDGQAASR